MAGSTGRRSLTLTVTTVPGGPLRGASVTTADARAGSGGGPTGNEARRLAVYLPGAAALSQMQPLSAPDGACETPSWLPTQGFGEDAASADVGVSSTAARAASHHRHDPAIRR
ncbi:MAG TPA: hypothetical protein VME01_03880 [Solirubrobacteraceae bacterium]|nr:hypothetical protein [Solirubrobacteraceae bacterium]